MPGSEWRSQRREKLTYAATGLLRDIESYCADQATGTVSTLAMRKLTDGDPKHAKRMRDQLVSAGYLEPTTDGWKLLHYETPRSAVPLLRVVEAEPEAEVRAEVRAEVLPQGGPDLEIVQEVPPLSLTQIPDPIQKEEEQGGQAAPSPANEPTSPPPEPSPQKRIAALESSYDAPTLLGDTREAIALSRRNGKVADSVWLKTLEQLAAFAPAVALDAMRLFTEHHADGDKNERYLLGIARNTKRRLDSGRPALRRVEPERRAPSAQEQAESDAFEAMLMRAPRPRVAS